MTNHTNLIDLKPCPFCGDAMRRGVADWFGHIDADNAECPIALEEYGPGDAGIWNTRTNDQAISTLTAELREALQGLADAVTDEANSDFGISGRMGARLSDAREALATPSSNTQGE